MPVIVQQTPKSSANRLSRPDASCFAIHRVRLLPIVVCAALAMLAAACGGGSGPKKSGASGTKPTSARAGSVDLLDPADDVMAGATAGGGDTTATRSTTPGKGGKAGNGDKATGAASTAAASSGTGRWSVMLATFSQPDHAERAAAFRTQLVRDYPELAGAVVRRVGKGSAIVVGRFEAPQDQAAQNELKRVKAIERGKAKPFAGAMLVRTSTDDSVAALKPHDIRNLRAKYPKVRPLFTLQVAAWSTFGDAGVRYDDMRKAAERYCAELRAKGVEAWFHHDEDSETSIVTVGNFDRRAYDGQTTLFSPEVEDLMRRFPAHLLNGEPLLVPVDQSRPKGATKPQPCRLVEVPEV